MWNKKAFQVLLSVYNEEKYIKQCFDSFENSLKNENWILLIGNDGSTDNSILEITEYIPQSSAQNIHLFDYNKAETVGEAKNRLIKESHNFKDKYPAILMMDADDEMLPERPKLINTAIEEKSTYVVGRWNKVIKKEKKWTSTSHKNANSAVQNLQFGPWCTLFHCDALPVNGKFFPEDKINNCGYEDLLTWNYLKVFREFTPTAHKNYKEPVHLYYTHEQSVSNSLDQAKVSLQRNTYWSLLEMIKQKKDIFNNPPTQKEVDRGIAEYIMAKKYKNAVMSRTKGGGLQDILPIHPLEELKLFQK
jgi:glycosyltransferase involved in cell wall biosynthesis